MELTVVAPGVVAFGTLSLRQNLSRIDLDRGVASSPTMLTSGNSVDRQPRLATDGETILFSSNRTGNLDLWTVHRTSGTVRQLTDDSASDWDPAFVNDGREIVWSSDRSGNLEIWIANADGSGARQVTQDGVDAENPTATPDGGRSIAFTGAVDNELGVFTQAFATSGDTASTRRPLAGFDPVWVTESFEVSLDGSVVILSNIRPGGTVMLAENVPYVTPPRAP